MINKKALPPFCGPPTPTPLHATHFKRVFAGVTMKIAICSAIVLVGGITLILYGTHRSKVSERFCAVVDRKVRPNIELTKCNTRVISFQDGGLKLKLDANIDTENYNLVIWTLKHPNFYTICQPNVTKWRSKIFNCIDGEDPTQHFTGAMKNFMSHHRLVLIPDDEDGNGTLLQEEKLEILNVGQMVPATRVNYIHHLLSGKLLWNIDRDGLWLNGRQYLVFWERESLGGEFGDTTGQQMWNLTTYISHKEFTAHFLEFAIRRTINLKGFFAHYQLRLLTQGDWWHFSDDPKYHGLLIG